MPVDHRNAWTKKAEIDYFNPFLSLWLACNSWYKVHYGEVQSRDREFINKIKFDITGRNQLGRRFKRLIDKDGKDGLSFRSNLEQLHYALEQAVLHPKEDDELFRCSFHQAITDEANHTNYQDLIKTPRINADGNVNGNDEDDVHKLDSIYIVSDFDTFFSGLFEVIYSVRNMLVHGSLNPDKAEHEVVKYCYLILWDLMDF